MDDAEPELTEAERRAIAEIRRKLDEEFQRKLDAELGPVADLGEADRRPRPRHRAARRGALAALVLGILAATGLGVVAIVSWDRHVDRPSVLSGTKDPEQDVDSTNQAAAMPPPAVDDVALLREALDEWIEATRRGDIAGQMRFYPARVPVYYTWRNASRDAVHAEKAKVFGAANRLVITTDRAAIELGPDGLSAVTRFRKRYVIEGPVVRRRGEVLQELRWTRAPDGWFIVGERDARVLSSS